MSDVQVEMTRAEEFVAAAIDDHSWCHVYSIPSGLNVACPFGNHGMHGRVMRRVRGSKMRTSDGLYDEFGAAWQFGDYFGSSRGAFLRDSLLDLFMTWSADSGFVVIISDPHQVLADEPDPDAPYNPLRALVDTIDEVAENYAEPIPGPESDPTARPALSFDVVLVTDAEHRDEVVRLWQAAGAPLTD